MLFNQVQALPSSPFNVLLRVSLPCMMYQYLYRYISPLRSWRPSSRIPWMNLSLTIRSNNLPKPHFAETSFTRVMKPLSIFTNQTNCEVCPQCNFNGSYNLSVSFTLGYYSRALKNHTKLCKRRQMNGIFTFINVPLQACFSSSPEY